MAHQMEAIRALECIRHGLAAGQRIGISAIADQDRHGGMGLQPLDQRLGGASFEDGHRLLGGQVHHQRGVEHTPPQRELIHTHDARRGQDDGFRALEPE
jgi:hypothetical protein